jgi:hypothetical protein
MLACESLQLHLSPFAELDVAGALRQLLEQRRHQYLAALRLQPEQLLERMRLLSSQDGVVNSGGLSAAMNPSGFLAGRVDAPVRSSGRDSV